MNHLPKCEVCGGDVYRRLVVRDGTWTARGELWHLDMQFLNSEDPGHEPVVTNAPDVIPLWVEA